MKQINVPVSERLHELMRRKKGKMSYQTFIVMLIEQALGVSREKKVVPDGK